MIRSIVLSIANRVSCVLFKNDLNQLHQSISSTERFIDLVNQRMLSALIVAEDKRFYSHCGFDIISIFGAFISTLRRGPLRGASTIDQQLVRTITNQKEHSCKRKIKEIILAAAINKYFCKDVIGKSYIYLAYYGWKMNGLQAALERLKQEHIITQDDIDYAVVAMLRYPLPKNISFFRRYQVLNRIKYIKKRMLK